MAAHMVEHVFPAVWQCGSVAVWQCGSAAVRQCVEVCPKTLRYFLDGDADCLNRVVGIAMSEVRRAKAGASTSVAAGCCLCKALARRCTHTCICICAYWTGW